MVLAGAHTELRRVRWGPTSWRVMLIAFLLVAGVAGGLLIRRAFDPPRPVVIPTGEGIAI